MAEPTKQSPTKDAGQAFNEFVDDLVKVSEQAKQALKDFLEQATQPPEPPKDPEFQVWQRKMEALQAVVDALTRFDVGCSLQQVWKSTVSAGCRLKPHILVAEAAKLKEMADPLNEKMTRLQLQLTETLTEAAGQVEEFAVRMRGKKQ